MPDSLSSLSSNAGQTAGGIGAYRAGQEVQKAVMAKLINSLPQSGQLQTPTRSVDRVQISQEAINRLQAEQTQQG